MAAASPGILRAVKRINTVTRLAPVTDGIARADIQVSNLKLLIQVYSFKNYFIE
jgi:hypothetical protein